MTTKRTPIRPAGGNRITPAAVAAFREMQGLEKSCDCQHRCRDGDCKKWDEQNDILRDEMRLSPWEWPTYVKRDSSGRDADALERYRLLKKAAEAAEAAEAA